MSLLLLVIFASLVSPLSAKMDISAGRVEEVARMLPAHAIGLGQPATNRTAWTALANEPAFAEFLKSANQMAAKPLPVVNDDLYLEYSRNGNRTHWQEAEFQRRDRMQMLALAECLEHQGHYMPALEDLIRTICAERTWVYPAHDGHLRNFNHQASDIDLGSSALGWELGTIDYLLSDELSPATHQLIRTNLQKRIFTPYRDMVEGRTHEIQWLRATHNWNAVCLAGVTGAALAAIDSPEERAWYIASAEQYIRYFLSGFGRDGYCSEGLGYWNYGFGRFVLLSETVREATDGKIDFFAEPAARLPSMFSRRAEILNGVYPSIADCPPGAKPDTMTAAYVCRRLALKPCSAGKVVLARPVNSIAITLLYSFLPEELPTVPVSDHLEGSSRRTWFSDGGVLICRPDDNSRTPFAVSLKGGNNNEHHNHNDVGSFIVVAGKSMMVVDPGAEVYTARTFGSHRYDSDVLNSFGHDVPVVAGQLQQPGAEAHAIVVTTNFSDAADTLALDIKSAYSVPSLTKLQRTFHYRRTGVPALTVRDDVAFTKPETFETALVTWSDWKQIGPNELSLNDGEESVRVKIDTGGVPFRIAGKKLEADVANKKPATRIGISLAQPVTNAAVTLTIAPALVR